MCGHVHLAWSCARACRVACRVAAPARVARRAERALWPAQRDILGIYRSQGSFSSGKRRRATRRDTRVARARRDLVHSGLAMCTRSRRTRATRVSISKCTGILFYESRATSTARHGPYLLVRLRVRPERHRAQSCAIALRSPAPERRRLARVRKQVCLLPPVHARAVFG